MTTTPLKEVSGFRWWDADTGCELVISTPRADRQLWAEYGRGALRNYRLYGVERALDPAALRSGDDTAMFFAARDLGGEVVAGMRAVGPLTSAEDSHALVEWDGRDGQDAVRKIIDGFIAGGGVLEMKTAWVDDRHPRSRELADAIARSGWHIATLMGAQFYIATADEKAADRWCRGGGTVAPIPATPYPDWRYRTKLLWWDRRHAIDLATPRQGAKMAAEAAAKQQAVVGGVS